MNYVLYNVVAVKTNSYVYQPKCDKFRGGGGLVNRFPRGI